MPDITNLSGDSTGLSFARGFWESENCDNSLASFPDGTNFSWGVLSFKIDGCDSNNYVEIRIINSDTFAVLKTFKYTENGRKEIDLSQYLAIPSTQDVNIMMEVTSYV